MKDKTKKAKKNLLSQTRKVDLANNMKDLKDKPLQRGFSFDAARTIDEEARTVEVSFSSDNDELLRWFGFEQLGHNDGEVDLSRLANGGAVLSGHDMRQHIGVVESVEVVDGKGRAVVRFSKNPRGEEVFRDVIDGIIRHTSVGYFVHEMVLIEERDNGEPLYRVTSWEPYEISFVAAGFDPDVGVGRDSNIDEKNKPTTREKIKMEDDIVIEKPDPTVLSDAVRAATVKAQNEARTTELSRVTEILKVGETYGADELARQAVNDGWSVDELNRKILEKNLGGNLSNAEDPNIGMDERDLNEYSFTRLIASLSSPNDTGLREAASFEFECHEAAQNKTRTAAKGALVPFDVLTQSRDISAARNARDLNVGTAGDGGNLVQTNLLSGSFIDSLENALALVQCGATILPGLTGNVAIPRQNGGASSYWLAENGAPTESGASFDQVPLTPKTIGAFTEFSRLLMLQSSIGVEQFVRNELALRLALGIDSAGINADGTGNTPTGILNQSGVGVGGAGGTNGSAPTWAKMVAMETDVDDANAAVARMCYLINSKTRGKLKTTLIESGTSDHIWDRRSPDSPINGYPAVVSNQMPKNLTKGSGTALSAAIFGNFADVLIGMWGALDLQVNPFSLDTSGAIRVTAFQDVDIALRHGASFSKIEDLITV